MRETAYILSDRPEYLFDLESSWMSILAGILTFMLGNSFPVAVLWGIVSIAAGANRWCSIIYGSPERHKAACLVSASTWFMLSINAMLHSRWPTPLVFILFSIFSCARYRQIVRLSGATNG